MGKEEISIAIKQTVISEIESGRLYQSEAARRLCVGRTTILERDFYAPRPNEKWLTDVTEFKWYEGVEVHKVYLSAILDLYDRRIVSYIISEHNDIPIVFNAFKAAVKANPDAHPLFHSDRGLRYISRIFHQMLEDAGMTQSISRVTHCIDNGPMEGLLGHSEAREILRQTIYFQAGTCPNDSGLYLLLQYRAGTAQSGCRYPDGEVPGGIGCANKYPPAKSGVFLMRAKPCVTSHASCGVSTV